MQLRALAVLPGDSVSLSSLSSQCPFACHSQSTKLTKGPNAISGPTGILQKCGLNRSSSRPRAHAHGRLFSVSAKEPLYLFSAPNDQFAGIGKFFLKRNLVAVSVTF